MNSSKAFIIQNFKILRLYLELRVIKMRWLYFICISCFVLPIGCTYKQNEKEGTTSFSDNSNKSERKELSDDIRLETYVNSLDIRMELVDSIFSVCPDTIEMNIINNSDYKLLSNLKYSLKHFESGNWKVVSLLENTIWPDVEMFVEPQSRRSFNVDLFLNLKPGRYQIEKEFSIVIPTIKRSTNNIRIILSDEFMIN